jgi:fucose 4-O-acetylase-like acetyltransferase
VELKPLETAEASPVEKTTAPQPAAPVKHRLEWVDCAKGIGIVLVVVGHVWHGLFQAGLGARDGFEHFQVDLIYAFHMPLFFFLSGLFIERSAQKGTGKFVRDKLATIAWPYVIWTFLHWSAKKLMAGRTTVAAPPFSDIVLGLFYDPYEHLWFLYVLLLFSFFFLLLYHLRFGLTAILLVGLAMYALDPARESGREQLQRWLADQTGLTVQMSCVVVLDRIVQSFVYLAAGAWLSRFLLECLPRMPLTLLGTLFVVSSFLLIGGFALQSVTAHGVYQGDSRNVWTSLPLAMLGIAATSALAVPIARVSWLGWVRRLGELSLQIYVAHIIFTAGVRIVLLKFLHIDSVALHVVVGTVAGVLFPVALALITPRLRMGWLWSLR